MKAHAIVSALGRLLFCWRRTFLALFVLITLVLGWSATHLKVDAGFEKTIPLTHEYMRTFTEYQKTFGGANRVIVALRVREGDIYTPAFFATLKAVTDEVFFLPGVDRATVTSLYTANVRFIEVVEDGFSGGNVIPADFSGSPEDLAKVRENVLKSGRVGRLVSNDFKGALISAELLEVNPVTGQRLDYTAVADKLESIRAKHQRDGLSLHIIGFAKAVGDIAEGARDVLLFFAAAFTITAVLLFFYSGSGKITAVALVCAMAPVVWLLGLLPLLGYGIDPMSILVPFLIFSIGVSHAVQMTNAWQLEILAACRTLGSDSENRPRRDQFSTISPGNSRTIAQEMGEKWAGAVGLQPEIPKSDRLLDGAESLAAAHKAFLKLFMPGAMALLANALGFLVILNIEIAMVRELAITASLGVALMIITNKMLLTILLSWMHLSPAELRRSARKKSDNDWLWQSLMHFAEPRRAALVLAAAALLLGFGAWQSRDLRTGDLGKGIPELHDSSRYNRDTAAILESFSIGVDVLAVIAQARDVQGACTDHAIMEEIDRFEMTMKNVQGVQGVLSLPGLAKIVNAGWNEGNPRWRVLSRDPTILAQSVTPIDTSSGLLDTDCNTMQILIFTRDHQGETIAHVVSEAKKFIAASTTKNLEFKLASGNVGVMAATNEAVDAAEVTMLLMLFGSISLLCLLEFRSWRATLCIILPLAIVAVLCNALMALLGIGLKVSTLPVIALGVGVGVDYGIYLYERLAHERNMGRDLPEAFLEALRQRGTAAAFTAATMAIGVGTWLFSALKFQADMGILLAFMFLVNMLGAILLLPALAAFLVGGPEKPSPCVART